MKKEALYLTLLAFHSRSYTLQNKREGEPQKLLPPYAWSTESRRSSEYEKVFDLAL